MNQLTLSSHELAFLYLIVEHVVHASISCHSTFCSCGSLTALPFQVQNVSDCGL